MVQVEGGWLQGGNSERLEYAIDLFLWLGNILFDSQPDFFDIDTEVIVDELVAHSCDILPQDADVFGPRFL